MRTQSILSLLAAASAASAQSQAAPVVANNPIGAQYLATLPEQTKYTVRGNVQIQTAPDGKGVDVSVSLSGLPAEGGPFMYHIHEKPVPADGNCTGTGAHLDPYKRGETPACDASKPETCQTGDLSGKHGNATAQSLSAKYTDLYLATLTNDPSFFGNLSVVVHLSNKTRISCANFTINSPGAVSSVPVSVAPSSGFAVPTGTGGYNGTLSATYVPTGTGSGTSGAGQGTGSPIVPSATSTPPTQSNSPAQKLTAGVGAMLGAAVAMML